MQVWLQRQNSTTHLSGGNNQFADRVFYLTIRNRRVMIDSDIAGLYGVKTFNLNKAVKRNRQRFPADFMFQLTAKEAEALRFQIGISKPQGRGGRRYLPYAFTQEGIAMLSSVLHSPQAVGVNIEIMRAFVRLRNLTGAVEVLARKTDAMERRYDAQFQVVFQVIRELKTPPDQPRRRIGFNAT